MALTDAERRAIQQQNAAKARQAIKDRRAAAYHQFMGWAKRGAAVRVAEIRAELQILSEWLDARSPT